MEKKVASVLILSILLLVIFINFNSRMSEHVANTMYYMQYYFIIGFMIILIWVLFSNNLIRILTVPIGVYYLFHLGINIIEIFDPELKAQLYKTKYINYCLSISMALSICIIPFLKHISKIIKEAITKLKHMKL